MEEVQVKRIIWDNDEEPMANGIKQCMVQYGYGYEHVAYTFQGPDHSYVILATEHIELSDIDIDMINDYYSGESQCQYLLDQNGKHLAIVD